MVAFTHELLTDVNPNESCLNIARTAVNEKMCRYLIKIPLGSVTPLFHYSPSTEQLQRLSQNDITVCRFTEVSYHSGICDVHFTVDFPYFFNLQLFSANDWCRSSSRAQVLELASLLWTECWCLLWSHQNMNHHIHWNTDEIFPQKFLCPWESCECEQIQCCITSQAFGHNGELFIGFCSFWTMRWIWLHATSLGMRLRNRQWVLGNTAGVSHRCCILHCLAVEMPCLFALDTHACHRSVAQVSGCACLCTGLVVSATPENSVCLTSGKLHPGLTMALGCPCFSNIPLC